MPTRMKAHSTIRGSHIAESEDLVLAPEDREEHDGGADVRDDQEQLQECPGEDAVVGAVTGDVASGVVEDRLKEIERCDRGDEDDEEEDPATLAIV